jgi:hypothetical protein
MHGHGFGEGDANGRARFLLGAGTRGDWGTGPGAAGAWERRSS